MPQQPHFLQMPSHQQDPSGFLQGMQPGSSRMLQPGYNMQQDPGTLQCMLSTHIPHILQPHETTACRQ
jgi:hypothetical protein